MSAHRANKPLAQEEHAYIEVLASFFANHVQQRWQFERIEYQQSHDVQTGLLNRPQFRSRAEAQAREGTGYAIVVIDVDAFHEVNESYGNAVGDANLSGRHAGDPKVVRAFVAAARAGVALEHIGVEITESDAMRDVEATRRVARALRHLNVRIAIDDFGTGYSSLSSLKRLPVDIVKIDRSFISGVAHSPHDAAIAETIISLAANFELDALGEGAEEPDEVEWLRQHGCRYVQGYAVCCPLPMDAFKA